MEGVSGKKEREREDYGNRGRDHMNEREKCKNEGRRKEAGEKKRAGSIVLITKESKGRELDITTTTNTNTNP